MSEATTKLICPKCGGEMRTYETNEVIVDQCTECRGLFLDRGELERLIKAEEQHYADRGRDEGRGDEEQRRPRREGFLGGWARKSGC